MCGEEEKDERVPSRRPPPELLREKIRDPPLRIVDGPPGNPTADEANMATAADKLDFQRGVVTGDRANVVEHLGREKRIVSRAEEERGDTDAWQVVDGARLCVVVKRIAEAVHRCRHDVIEVPERAHTIERGGVAEVRMTGKLLPCL